jgi:hypothetical protein
LQEAKDFGGACKMSHDLKSQAMLEHLMLQGAVEFQGIDDITGEMMYMITDKMKEVSPEIYKELKDQYEHHMFQLIDQGPTRMTWRIRL